MILLWFGCTASENVANRNEQDSGPMYMDFEIPVSLIPSGTFEMGCSQGDDACAENEMPQHTVEITRDYYMMQTEVTQGLYQAVMGENPAEFQLGDDYPVEEVNWYDAVFFANELSRLEGREQCYEIDYDTEGIPLVSWIGLDCTGWRLPTEAEWEYAARGGESFIYSGSSDPLAVAWFQENALEKTHPVAQFQANGFGLYDMSGNVEEWCWDGYQEGGYQYALEQGIVQDPLGGDSDMRPLRGGGWGAPDRLVRVSTRIFVGASSLRRIFGIRLVIKG